MAARAYLAEGLAVREIQNEYGGTLIREFPIASQGRRLILDGLLNVGRNWFVIETKYFRQASAFAKSLVRIANEVRAYQEALKDKVLGDVSVILAVIAEQLIEKYKGQIGNSIQIKIYRFSDLAAKYGVADDKA